MNSDDGLVLVPPTVSLLELEDGDQWHEIWKTDWTEHLLPQLGKNWRMFLASVLRGSDTIEWVFFREYENLVREVICHMSCSPSQWGIVLEIANGRMRDLTKGINELINPGVSANEVDLVLHQCGVEERTIKAVGILLNPENN